MSVNNKTRAYPISMAKDKCSTISRLFIFRLAVIYLCLPSRSVHYVSARIPLQFSSTMQNAARRVF